MRVIVVGAGIAGCSVVRACHRRGFETVHISDGNAPSSLAATAVLRRGYHTKTPRDARLWDRSMEMYKAWGVEMLEGADVSSYQRQGVKRDKDWRMLDPAAPLFTSGVEKGILSRCSRNEVSLADGRVIKGDKVVVAVGSSHGDGKITHGVTWVASPRRLAQPSLRVHYIAPYKTLTAGVVGGRARLGSSSSTTVEGAREQAKKMLDIANDLGITAGDSSGPWRPVYGQRIQTEPRAFQHSRGHYVLTGYHRTGYALAPAEAEEMVNSW
jgi:hypothetical protein